ESAIHRVVEVGDVHVDTAGNAVVLTGSVPDAASAERVMSIARAHFPDKAGADIVNLLAIGGNQQVMMEVTVSEISRSKSRRIGTNWIANFTSDGGTKVWFAHQLIDGLGLTNFFGSAFPIGTGVYELFVNALEENGVGKILAQPTLVARTGATAKF